MEKITISVSGKVNVSKTGSVSPEDFARLMAAGRSKWGGSLTDEQVVSAIIRGVRVWLETFPIRSAQKGPHVRPLLDKRKPFAETVPTITVAVE